LPATVKLVKAEVAAVGGRPIVVVRLVASNACSSQRPAMLVTLRSLPSLHGMFAEPRGVVVVPIQMKTKAHRKGLRVYYEIEDVANWVLKCSPMTSAIVFDACYAACGVHGATPVAGSLMLKWQVGGIWSYGCPFAQLSKRGGTYVATAMTDCFGA